MEPKAYLEQDHVFILHIQDEYENWFQYNRPFESYKEALTEARRILEYCENLYTMKIEPTFVYSMKPTTFSPSKMDELKAFEEVHQVSTPLTEILWP